MYKIKSAFHARRRSGIEQWRESVAALAHVKAPPVWARPSELMGAFVLALRCAGGARWALSPAKLHASVLFPSVGAREKRFFKAILFKAILFIPDPVGTSFHILGTLLLQQLFTQSRDGQLAAPGPHAARLLTQCGPRMIIFNIIKTAPVIVIIGLLFTDRWRLHAINLAASRAFIIGEEEQFKNEKKTRPRKPHLSIKMGSRVSVHRIQRQTYVSSMLRNSISHLLFSRSQRIHSNFKMFRLAWNRALQILYIYIFFFYVSYSTSKYYFLQLKSMGGQPILK